MHLLCQELVIMKNITIFQHIQPDINYQDIIQVKLIYGFLLLMDKYI
jgi:hypothetical protein